jgi:hypothetical protein
MYWLSNLKIIFRHASDWRRAVRRQCWKRLPLCLVAANVALAIALIDLSFRQGFPTIGAYQPSPAIAMTECRA